MPDEDKILATIVHRLPDPSTVHLLLKLRSVGYEWEDIEARTANVPDDIAAAGLYNRDECARYYRRVLIEAHATETRGTNN